MEELLNEYMELLNKAELNRAVALKLGKDEIVKSQETKMCGGEITTPVMLESRSQPRAA